MIPADFRCGPGCESAGAAPLTVLWAGFGGFCTDLSPCMQDFSAITASHRTAAPPFGTQALHANPKPQLQADFTEINTLLYLGIEHLHYVGSSDSGEWE